MAESIRLQRNNCFIMLQLTYVLHGSAHSANHAHFQLYTVTIICLQALLHHLPVILSNIVSVWLEVEASGDDDPATDRSEMFYGQSLFSGGSSSSGVNDSCGFDDGGLLLGLSLTASEEAEGESTRKQLVRAISPATHGL